MGSTVSTVPRDAPQALLELDRNIQVAKFTAVASVSVAVYDYIVCLDDEVELVWKARPSVFKYLALFSRYMAIVVPLGIAVLRLGNWDDQQCRRMKPLGSITTTLGMLSANYVLGLRTAAVYSYQRNVTLLIGAVLLMHTILAFWSATKWIIIDLPPEIPGCFVRPGDRHSLGLSLYWVPASVTDVVLFVLTVSKVFPIWSMSKESRLSFIILRDEILYYGVISSLMVATNVLLYVGTPALGPILAPLCLTLSPVLVFHLVLNLRSVTKYPYRSSQEAPIPMEELLASTYRPPPNELLPVAVAGGGAGANSRVPAMDGALRDVGLVEGGPHSRAAIEPRPTSARTDL